MKLQQVWDFVKEHGLMVVSTVSADGKPQAAVVEFGETDDFTLIIDTLKSSRKYKNLQTNRNVAVVVGWDNDITVQIDAIAHELSGAELQEAKQPYFAKNPRAKEWESNPDIAYFAFKPTWIRYSDVSKKPWLIEEFTLGQ